VCCINITDTCNTTPGRYFSLSNSQEEVEIYHELLQEQVHRLGSQIKERILLPVYSNLPTEMQANIFEPTPPNARKVILNGF